MPAISRTDGGHRQTERKGAEAPSLEPQSPDEGRRHQGKTGKPGQQRAACAHDQVRHKEAADVEQETARDLNALPWRRERLQDREIPEDDLEKLRRVAHEFDEGERKVAHQPVDRQPHDADEQAEQRCRDDAHGRHQKGVQQADKQRLRVGVDDRPVDQMKGDVEAGPLDEEAEAEVHVPAREIRAEGVDQEPADRDDDQQEDPLADVGRGRRAPDHDDARTLRWLSARTAGTAVHPSL